MNIDLKEGLKHLFRGVSAAADTLLHLVERELGGVEQRVVHRVNVEAVKLLHLRLAGLFDLGVNFVVDDRVNQVNHRSFNFEVFGLESFALALNVLLLHRNELF